jgi:hypothetical protein
MDKALDEIIRENTSGMRRFNRGGPKRGRNFGNRPNQNFNNRQRVYRPNRRFNDNNVNIPSDRPLNNRRPQNFIMRGGNRRPFNSRRVEFRSNGPRDFGYNNGIMKVCIYHLITIE